MNLIVVVIGLLMVPIMNMAQDTLFRKECNSVLFGKVLDEHDNTPLGYASVYILELKTGVESDAKGNYNFSGICDGKYTLKISHIGCESFEKVVVVNGKTKLNFYPEHHLELLKDVDVIAKRLEEQSTQVKDEVSTEKINESKGKPLGEALKDVTGVTTLNTGNSIVKPIIHGMHSNRILILNNGVRQEGQQWGVEHAPEIDPFTAGKMVVIKGANSVRYGSDALAGVIVIDPKPLRDSAGVSGEFNTVAMSNGRSGTASAFLEGNFAKLSALSWRVQGTFKKSGNISTPNYYLSNTGLEERNFSYLLLWKKRNYQVEVFYSQFNTDMGIFSGSHIGNLTDLKAAFARSEPYEKGEFSYNINRPMQHIEHELFKFKSVVNMGSKFKFSAMYTRQYNLRNEYDLHRPLNDSLANLNKPELQFEITSHTADLIIEHQSINRFTGSFGVSGITQGNTYEGRVLVPNFRNYTGGAFWIERWRKNKVELEAGIRYDYKKLQVYRYEFVSSGNYKLVKPQREFSNFSGNIGAIYKVDSTLNFSFNAGTAWRAPSINELYSDGLHHGAAALEYGNDSLISETAYNFILTLKYKPNKNLYFEVSPYINYVSNFIYRQPSMQPVLTIQGAFPAFYFAQTNAVLRGCDIYLGYTLLKRLEIAHKASLLRAWDVTENNWLILMPSDRYETEIKWRFKPKRTLKELYVSVSGVYVTKQWRIPANVDFAPPPQGYFLMNARAAASIKIKKQELQIGFGIDNALNETYRDYLDRFRYFNDAIGRNYTLRLTVPINVNFSSNK